MLDCKRVTRVGGKCDPGHCGVYEDRSGTLTSFPCRLSCGLHGPQLRGTVGTLISG